MGGYFSQQSSKAKNYGGGALAGGAALGPVGGIVGGSQGLDNIGGKLDAANPYVAGPRNARDAANKSNAAAGELFDQTGVLNKNLDQADTNYSNAFGSASKQYLSGAQGLLRDYTGKMDTLNQEAINGANDSRYTYNNSIMPSYKDAMEKAKTNADSAMTLAEAGDPNNPVMKSIRDLYNQEGSSQQGIYNQQGQAAHKQGQADYGVLSALGAQSAKGQFGAGGPLTAGQMGQIYNSNQGQASNAYSNAQQRMYDLQQQGINANVGLRSQGIGAGINQSNNIYGLGQQAQGRYSDTIKDLQGGQNSFDASQAAFRGEEGGYAGNSYNAGNAFNSDRFNIGQMGADINKGNAYAGTGRQQQALNQRYGVQQQNINNVAGAQAASNAGKAGFISSALGAGGQIAGAYAGAPRTTYNQPPPPPDQQQPTTGLRDYNSYSSYA